MNDVMTKALKAARAVIEDEGYEVKQAVLTATFEPDEAGYRNGASAFPADMEDAYKSHAKLLRQTAERFDQADDATLGGRLDLPSEN